MVDLYTAALRQLAEDRAFPVQHQTCRVGNLRS